MERADYSGKAERAESHESEVKSSFDVIDEHLKREQSRLNEILDGVKKDVVVTGSNEERRINEQADWERQQVIDYYQRTRHVQLNGLKGSAYGFDNKNHDGSYFPATNDWQLKSELIDIEERRKKALALAREVVQRRSKEQNDWMNLRSRSLRESAQNLSAQMSDKKTGFGLRKTGTSLYVRQYVSPHTNLPPTRPGVARVVPHGTFALEELENAEALKQNK